MDPGLLLAGGAVAVGGVASLTGHLLTYRVAKSSQTIVQGNGKGDVGKMLAKVLTIQEKQDSKLDSVLKWQGTHDAQHTRDVAASAAASGAVAAAMTVVDSTVVDRASDAAAVSAQAAIDADQTAFPHPPT